MMPRKHAPQPPIPTVLGLCRADLALAAVEAGVQMRRVDHYCWAVTSSHHGSEYRVTRDPDDLHLLCSCQAASHGIDCRHAALALLVEASGAVEAILPAPPERGY